jgi:hypothetical protein
MAARKINTAETLNTIGLLMVVGLDLINCSLAELNFLEKLMPTKVKTIKMTIAISNPEKSP